IVHSTSDGCATWNTYKIDYIRPALFGIQAIDNMRSTVVGEGGYIGHSMDGGQTYSSQESNTPNNLYGVAFGNSQAGTAVGLRGNIMRITTDEMPVSAVRDNAAPQEQLSLNIFPNPASDAATIEYELPSAGFLTIEIYSLEGKLISALPPAFRPEGKYERRFSTDGLSS